MIPLQKFLRMGLEGLWVNRPSVENVKSLMQQGNHVILVPTYKSFADQFIIQYTLLNHKMQIPFTIGNREDTPRVPIVDTLLQQIGYISSLRSRDQSIQESYINQAILRELMVKHQLSIVYQNDIRSRTGKFSKSIVSDLSVLWILQAYMTAL